jgi:Ca-activated chloride channel family protein
VPPGLVPTSGAPGGKPVPVEDFARAAGDRATRREGLAESELKNALETAKAESKDKEGKPKGAVDSEKRLSEAIARKKAYDDAKNALDKKDRDGVPSIHTGKLGVDLAIETNYLRNLARVERSAVCNVYGRNCMEVGGVWIDEEFGAKTVAVNVKAQSAAYFRILERHPQIKSVFKLGNHLVWITPSGKALVIDTTKGNEKMSDAEIDSLFVAKK